MFRRILLLGVVLLMGCARSAEGQSTAQEKPSPVVRMAEIEVDPNQIDAYRAALRKQIDAAVRLEPGVLALYAVSVKDRPEQVRVFERYASRAAYESHIQTAHFLKYKATTQVMVRSLKLIDVDPILLLAKPPE